MKQLIFYIIIAFSIIACAQTRKVETDTLKARKALKVKSGSTWKNVTSFLTGLDSLNRIQTAQIADSNVTRSKLSTTVNIMLQALGGGTGYPPDDETIELYIVGTDTSLKITHSYLVDSVGLAIFDSISAIDSSNITDQKFSANDIYSPAAYQADYRVFISNAAGNSFAKIDSHYIENGTIDPADLWSSTMILDGDGLTSISGVTFGQSNTGMNVNVDAQSVQITTDTLEINAVYANMHQGDDPDTVTIASSGTYYDIKEMDAYEESHMSVAIELGTITIPYTGVYAVSGSFSFGGTSGAIMNISLVVDDAPDTTVTLQRKLGAAGDIGSASCFNVHSFTAGEVLNFAVTSDDNSDIFIFRNSQIAVYMIGK